MGSFDFFKLKVTISTNIKILGKGLSANKYFIKFFLMKVNNLFKTFP